MNTIQIDHLSKRYRGQSRPALNDVSLTISAGMFGLLGKNGAGKSTLMRILTTLDQATTGTVQLCGIPITQRAAVRNQVGYLPQNFGFYPNMTVRDALTYLAILAHVPPRSQHRRINALLAQVNLTDQACTKVKALSGGMRQRLGIAQALVNQPKVLIVDEPTAGLDPEERIRFRNLLTEFAQDRIVLLSTHIVSDIEATTNRIGVLNQGRLLFTGTTAQLQAQATGHVFTRTLPLAELSDYKSRYEISEQVVQGNTAHIRFLATAGIPGANVVAPTLEEAYLYLQSRQTRQEVRQ
ncbi:ABC transporter ATP-binding protein [Schleiferilactobacillus perolens]|uniref:Metal ion ABC transporter ATPase n=1 Tax=Schleiferilactobacillus perolens DSM 12744 TaxID=1423792 RepID=A0A0R1MTD7_9LACO|nr:ABC transporter ATP-binding protein [Schleiferilactobacillus perolens]KRL11343.1 metal ion ABC transporter ATPase [Schleiferilactobacillus perolens DSM 12744]